MVTGGIPALRKLKPDPFKPGARYRITNPDGTVRDVETVTSLEVTQIQAAGGNVLFIPTEEQLAPIPQPEVELPPEEPEIGVFDLALAEFAPFETPEGLFDISAAREAGVSDDSITLIFGEEALRSLTQPAVPPQPQPEPRDIDLLYANYQRTGGTLSFLDWQLVGSPLTTEAEVSVTEAVRTVFPERFPTGLIPTGTFRTQEQVVTDLITRANEQPGELLQELVARGRTPEVETLINTLYDVQTGDIDRLFEGIPEPLPPFEGQFEVTPIQNLLIKALPLIVIQPTATRLGNLEAAVELYSTNPDRLRRDLITVGRNEDTEALVRELFPQITDQGIKDYFNERVPGTVEGISAEALGKLPTLTWLDRVQELKDNPEQLVPFVASGVQIVKLGQLLKIAKDIEDGKDVSQEDLLILKAYVDRATADTTWGFEVADVISQLVPFAGEFIATGGIFSAGKTATVKASELALKKIATRTGLRILESKLAKFGVEVAGVVGGGTLRTIPAGVTRIPAATLEKQLITTLQGDEEAVLESAVKAFGEQWVEIVSESTGGLFAPLGNAIKGQMIKAGLFKAFIKANPTANPNNVRRVFDRLGYNGVIEEMLEERVGEVAHGILEPLGLSDQEFSIPSLRQLSVELVAFSVPGAAALAIQQTPLIFEKLAPRIKEAIRSEAGFARIPGERPEEEAPEEIEPTEPVVGELTVTERFDRIDVLRKRNKELQSQQNELIKKVDEIRKVKPIQQDEVTRINKEINTVQDELAANANEITELQTPTAPKVPAEEVARPEPGAPEAGIQPSLIEGVPAQEVRPRGKSEVTQISMDDQLKLRQAQQDAEEADPEQKAVFEAQQEITGLEVSQKTDPVAQTRVRLGNRNVSLDSFVSIREQNFPETFTVKQAEALFPGHDFSAYTQKGTPQFNKVPRDVALDQLSKELNMTPDEIANRVMAIRQEKRRIKDLQGDIKQKATEKPLAPLPEVSTEEVTANWESIGQPKLTLKQIDALIQPFAAYVVDPNTATLYELNRQLQSEERVKRFEDLKVRTQELIVVDDLTFEQAQKQAISETQPGKLPTLTTDYLDGITGEMRDAHFAKVHHVFDKLGPEYQGERMSTLTALTNALDGKPIPHKRGTGSILFPAPKGGSAWDRLNYVFGKQPKVFKAIEKMGDERKPLKDTLEGVFHEVGREPIDVDSEMADYLRSLATWSMQETTGMDIPGEARGVLTFDPTGKLGLEMTSEQVSLFVKQMESLQVSDQRTPEELEFAKRRLELGTQLAEKEITKDVYDIELMRAFSKAFQRTDKGLFVFNPTGKLGLTQEGQQIMLGEQPFQALNIADLRHPAEAEFAKEKLDLSIQLSEGKITEAMYGVRVALAREKHFPPTPMFKFDAPIERAFKDTLFNFLEKSTFNRVLKELLLSPLDIGNFLRANKASFDNSFLRQSKLLLSGHPILAWQAHAAAWQSMFSQKHTEAEWQLITRDPDFAIYDQIRVDTGHDPLRVPAFAATKGTEQYRTSEEFGFTRQDVERAIPKFTAWLPHVKYSERGFSAGTNKAVWGVWKQKLAFARRYSEKIASGDVVLKEGEAFDIIQEMTDEQSMLGDLIQRANLRRFSGLAPAMNAFFFAARSKIGRLLLPKHLLGITVRNGKVGFNPRVMKEAWKDFIAWIGYISGIMFLGDWLDIWEVETDPRNAEFMSARIGNTRIDPWAGYRQFVVLYARLITGTGISSVTGAEYDADPESAMQSFVRNSISPLASILLEFWTGRNFLGQVIDFADARYWVEQITPFSASDIWEAAEEDWRVGIAVTIPAVYGEGVQTYTGDWEENFTNLGLPKYVDNTAYGVTEPPYDTADFWSDTAKQFDTESLSELTAAKGFPNYIRAIVEAKLIKEHLDTLPSDRLVNLNEDPNVIGEPTFTDYYDMWQDREKLVTAGDEAEITIEGKTFKGEDAVEAFDKDERTKNAHRGNFSQRQFALLNQYWSITNKKEQADFLEEHKAEIGVNPRQDWLRKHPKENAELAIWGQAKVLTKEAYDHFNTLAKQLDIPDNAVPELLLPPETSIDTHFTYEEMVSEGTHGSVEADLLLVKDQIAADEAGVESYVVWRNQSGQPLQLPDKQVEYYQLRVDNQQNYDDLEEAQEADDEEEIEAIRARKVDGETFHDVERRVEAMGKGTREVPIPDETVSAYVGHMQIVDDTSGNSAEAKLNRYDNPDLNAFLMSRDHWGKSKAQPLDKDKAFLDNYLVPRWRIDVKYRTEDSEYNALETASERQEYLQGNDPYRMDRRRRQALSMQNIGFRFPLEQIENFVDYHEIEVKGFRQERFLVENGGQDPDNLAGFAAVMHLVGGIDIPRPEEVPAVQFDDIFDQFEEQFTQLEGFSDNDSEHYIEFPEPGLTLTETRKKASDALRFDADGTYTEFGLAELERNAHDKLRSIQTNANYAGSIKDYVGYYTIVGEGKPDNYFAVNKTDLWYEDDWYMLEHFDFYTDIYQELLGNEPFEAIAKVPSRAIFAKYLQYLQIDSRQGKLRDDFRFENLDLDDWLVLKFGYTPVTEKRRRAALTTGERLSISIADLERRLRTHP